MIPKQTTHVCKHSQTKNITLLHIMNLYSLFIMFLGFLHISREQCRVFHEMGHKLAVAVGRMHSLDDLQSIKSALDSV